MSKYVVTDEVYFHGLKVMVVGWNGQKYTIKYANGATGEAFESDLVAAEDELSQWETDGGR